MVSGFWPAVSPLIRVAIERTGLSLFSDIEADALAGRSLLWIAWNGRDIEAAAVTQLQITDAGKVCVIVACGGKARRWQPLLSQVEATAAQEGCGLVRIFGRRGWLRALDGYNVSNVVIDKPIKCPPTGCVRRVAWTRAVTAALR